jgi:hypothetical protein
MSADDVFTLANWLLLSSLVVGVVSTYAIVASGKIRDAKAKREVADAGEAAAKANERAAQLEKDAAFARLETERLKNLMAWRRIATDQHAKLVAALKGKIAAEVWVEVVDSDPEASQFYTDLCQTLNDAEVKIQRFSGWERAVGLQMTNASSSTGQLLKEAFANVGIYFEERAEPGVNSAAGKVEIIVGSKPPRFYTSEHGPVRVR